MKKGADISALSFTACQLPADFNLSSRCDGTLYRIINIMTGGQRYAQATLTLNLWLAEQAQL